LAHGLGASDSRFLNLVGESAELQQIVLEYGNTPVDMIGNIPMIAKDHLSPARVRLRHSAI
jgi:hypothetical protein